MSIGGTLIAHNCMQYDYCLDAALRSLLGVCDEIVIVEAESTDGTRDSLESLAKEDSRILIIDAAWNPNAGGLWLSSLTNLARCSLGADYHISLQADEVIHEDSYPEIRRLATASVCASVRRWNFWNDHRHVIPNGRVCGSRVVRLASADVPSVGDAENLEPSRKGVDSGVQIFHYGFIRDPKALVRKAIPMQEAFSGHYDKIFDDVAIRGSMALIDPKYPTAVTEKELIPYQGSHPKFAHKWLQERGFQL